MNENNRTVGTVVASDSDSQDSVTGYSISGGVDSSRFSIADDGVLSFKSVPNYENPSDSGKNNEYVVEVTVKGGSSGRRGLLVGLLLLGWLMWLRVLLLQMRRV